MSAEPGLLDSPEYTRLYELSAPYPMKLAELRRYREAAELLQLRLVYDARMRGESLSQIGAQLGVTKQAVAAMLSRFRHR